MPGGYTGTSFDFLAAPDEAFGVLDGAGHLPVAQSATMYRDLSRALSDVAGKVRDSARVLLEANEGAAGEAARAHLERLALVGDAADAEATLAMNALYDQADQVAMVRTEVEGAQRNVAAAQELGVTPDPSITASANANLRDEARQAAAAAGNLYQSNVNHNYTAAFQPFDPPPAAPVDAGAGPSGSAPGWGSGGGPALTPAGAPATPTSGTGGPGDVGATGGGAGVAPGGAASAAAGGGLPGAAGSGAGVPGGSGTGGPVGAPVTGPAGGGSRPAPAPGDPTGTRPGPSAATLGRSPATRPDPHRPAPLPLTTWRPGRPWSARTGTSAGDRDGAGSGRGGTGGPAYGSAPGAPGTGSRTPGSGAGPSGAGPSGSTAGGRYGYAGMPMTGAGAGTGGDGGQRARPAWLVEEDPDAVWFGDLQYTDPVIGGDRSGGDRR